MTLRYTVTGVLTGRPCSNHRERREGNFSLNSARSSMINSLTKRKTGTRTTTNNVRGWFHQTLVVCVETEMAWSPARYLYSSRSPLTHLSRRYHAPLLCVLPTKQLDSRTSCVTCQWPGQLCRRTLGLSSLRIAASQSANSLRAQPVSVVRVLDPLPDLDFFLI